MGNIKNVQKKPLHPIQMYILARLIKDIKAKFGDLRPSDVSTDHFTYHLKKLQELGLVAVDSKGNYFLTPEGKRFAMDIDLTLKQKVEYSKRSVILRVIRENGGKYEYLFYRRLKQPYYGFVGFPAGKILSKESPVEAAIRELKEETGLVMLDWRLIKIERDVIVKPNASPDAFEVESDFYLYFFDIYKTAGKLVPDKREGEYFFATLEEVKKMDTFPGLFNEPSETSWLTLPKRYEEYKKLKTLKKWKNFPERITHFRQKPYFFLKGQIYYEEWYFTDEGW